MLDLSEDDKTLKPVAEGAIPETVVKTKRLVKLQKRGRMLVSSSYDIRFQKLISLQTLRQIEHILPERS